MTFFDLINENLDSDSIVINEGFGDLFKVSPALAFFALKDGVVTKVKDAKKNIEQSAKDLEISAKQKKEKLIAQKQGASGDKDDDTVYKYTKEQKAFLVSLYKKYGSEIIKDINDYRVNIAAPYQVIKREVSRNHMITDKTRVGMTKEDYYRYRESGRRKIEKMGTYFKDHDDMYKEQERARRALSQARETYNKFTNSSSVDLASVNMEKIFDEAGIGLKKLNGYSLEELGTTFGEIKRLEKILAGGPNSKNPPGRYVISGSERTGSGRTLSKEDMEFRINNLREKGISNVTDTKKYANKPYGSFREAFSFYLLRREMVSQFRENSVPSEYKKFYSKVLKDALDSAQRIYDNKYANFMNLKNTITLNSYEKKIWKPKFLGDEFSGSLNDWKLVLKPEDFKGVEYREKSPKILQAEKDIDRESKRFERKLKEKMNDEDLTLCKKYRIFSNFLTVKEFRSLNGMFKSTPKVNDEVDIEDKINSIITKNYDSIKELEAAQKKLSSLISGENLNSELKEKCNKFLKKIDPKSEEQGKTNTKEIENFIDKINSNPYSKTSAALEKKAFEDAIEDFKRLNGEESLRSLNYEINQSKDKLNRIINNE